MKQPIIGFHQDELGDWVAELACFHGQHVRHQPPFINRPWVTTEQGRASMLGHELDCVRCDHDEPANEYIQNKHGHLEHP
ncbi:DUF3565 domain-containing protein [Litoribrevibacter euphylliae]|uniref:DUF3565 domain-containing protein n=1 Tax=Litoribrevibacter euphylliae TaxID=1834034 RepID=A0ABV7HN25_9GAMM